MNDRHGRTASPAEKKGIRSSAALALAVGLVLACSGSAVLASSNPIPGVDIIVKKNPGHNYPISVPTNKDGTYEFTGLTPGEYDLSIAGRRVQTISVGANRSIGGMLNREADGTASITINGQAAALGPAAAIVTSRDNPAGRDKTRGKAGIGGVDDNPADGPQGVAAKDATSALSQVMTTRGRVEKPGAPDGDKTSLPGIAGDPIQGIPIGLEGDPEGMRIGTTRTDEHGAFRFDKLPAGKYRLVIAGQRVQAISVGANRSIGGVLNRNAEGMASIAFNGQAAALGPAAAIVTSRDNPEGKGRDNPRGKAGIGGVDDPSADGNQRVAAEDDISALGSVSTTRGRVEKPGAPDGDKTSDKKTSGEGRKNDDDRFGKFGNDMNAGPAMNPAMGGFMGASPVMGPIGPGAGGSGGAMGPRR